MLLVKTLLKKTLLDGSLSSGWTRQNPISHSRPHRISEWRWRSVNFLHRLNLYTFKLLHSCPSGSPVYYALHSQWVEFNDMLNNWMECSKNTCFNEIFWKCKKLTWKTQLMMSWVTREEEVIQRNSFFVMKPSSFESKILKLFVRRLIMDLSPVLPFWSCLINSVSFGPSFMTGVRNLEIFKISK